MNNEDIMETYDDEKDPFAVLTVTKLPCDHAGEQYSTHFVRCDYDKECTAQRDLCGEIYCALFMKEI